MAPTSKEFGLPSTGAVLAFMVDCLGVPKETDEYSYKELERLAKGGLATEKYWAVARKVMDAIVGSFLEANAASQKIDTVFRQKVSAPIKRIHWQMHKGLLIPVPEFSAPREAVFWKRNSAGELEDFGEILVHDWTEFLHWHEFLVNQCGRGEKTRINVIFHWACAFAVPFLAVNLLDYARNNTQLESGMPRGNFWYLPLLILPKGAGEKPHVKWPVNSVLEWWEDLLGCELTSHASLLCDPGFDPDNARRQVRAWRHEDRTPDQATIERWCKLSWADKYTGTFSNDESVQLNERWNRCRAFLVKKGFHNTTHNWLEGIRGKPRETFQNQYRGEMLELEILPFKQTSFAAFFDSPDPVAAGLPVAELIERIAERYAQPTNEQLKARLIIAAAFQRAFSQTLKSQGRENALRILDWFQQVYNFLVDLHNRTSNGAEILRLLRNAPESQGGLRFACGWLFDEDSWRRRPAEIMELFDSSA
jgi:uncharacterized protein (DUF2384 family)